MVRYPSALEVVSPKRRKLLKTNYTFVYIQYLCIQGTYFLYRGKGQRLGSEHMSVQEVSEANTKSHGLEIMSLHSSFELFM